MRNLSKRCFTALFLLMLAVCNAFAYDYKSCYNDGFIAGMRAAAPKGESAGYILGLCFMLAIYIIAAILLIRWAVRLIIHFKKHKKSMRSK